MVPGKIVENCENFLELLYRYMSDLRNHYPCADSNPTKILILTANVLNYVKACPLC